jgi:hypothetical protein
MFRTRSAAISISRREALEDAAKVADMFGSYEALHIAAAIRALKDSERV